MFYQAQYSAGTNMIHHESGCDFGFPAHLHENFELITVTAGEMQISVAGRVYSVTQGQAVLVFPNQLHSLETKNHSEHELWIFSPNYVQAYASTYKDRVPQNNLFTLDPFCLESLLKLRTDESLWRLKGILYSVCAAFDENVQYQPISANKDQLLLRIFDYVQRNYTEDCTLAKLSQDIGFHYVYLSRYFKERTKITFSEYVMYHRLSEACYLLTNTQDSIVSAALSCGFGSLRSFNRCFRRYYGITPREYRSKTEKQ